MNPDVYMPMFWSDFWQAVKGWPDAAVVGYLKALTHYWFHLHCAGLPDDSDKLRRICECDKADWDEVCGLVFDNDKFFKQDANGLWRQKRADKEWKFCEEKTKANKLRAVNGANAMKKKWAEIRKQGTDRHGVRNG